MVALTATAWTEAVESRVIQGKHKRNRVKLTVNNGGAFYPSSGGWPLPTTMGMVRNIDYVNIIQPLFPPTGATGAAGTISWHYVVSEHSIHGYWETGATSTSDASPVMQGELPTTWKPSAHSSAGSAVMYVEAVGW
jgi:hypothetical protein